VDERRDERDGTTETPDEADGPTVDPPRPPIEPEGVDAENAAFVALGVALTVVVVAGVV
jgi:hypothetical protein